MIFSGTVMGWSAALPKVEEDEQFNLTKISVKWLVSVNYIASIPSCMVAGYLMELTGPLRLLSLLLPLATALWLLLAFSQTILTLFAARGCLGFLTGLFNTVAQILVAELCEPNIRGFASSLPEIMVSVGVLYAFLLVNFLGWRLATALCSAPFLPVLLMLLFVPESPYWLVRRERTSSAIKSLSRLLGNDLRVHVLLDEIETGNREQQQTSIKEQVRNLTEPRNLKPLLIVLAIFLLREMGGQSFIFFYSVYVFKEAETGINAFTCTVFVGAVRLICTAAGGLAMDSVGRRGLLVATTFVCSLSLYITGGVLLSGSDGREIKLIPLVCILVYVASYGVGVGPVPWTLVGELLPTPIRFLGGSVVTTFFATIAFIATNFYPDLVAAIGIEITFVLFATCSAVMSAVVWKILPETRGRTLLELQRSFSPDVQH